MKFLLATFLALILFATPGYAKQGQDKESPAQPTVFVVMPAPGAKYHVPVIVFNGTIDEDSANAFIDAFEKLEPSADAIVIEITTYGGSVDDGFRMARAIERSSTPVACVAENETASMGYFVLQSCPVRAMTKRTILTAHYPYMSQISAHREQDFENAARHQRGMNEMMLQQVCRRTKMTCQEVKENLDRGDWALVWYDALKVGAVDRVVDSVEWVQQTLAAKGKL